MLHANENSSLLQANGLVDVAANSQSFVQYAGGHAGLLIDVGETTSNQTGISTLLPPQAHDSAMNQFLRKWQVQFDVGLI
jgi:hypothetical protein